MKEGSSPKRGAAIEIVTEAINAAGLLVDSPNNKLGASIAPRSKSSMNVHHSGRQSPIIGEKFDPERPPWGVGSSMELKNLRTRNKSLPGSSTGVL